MPGATVSCLPPVNASTTLLFACLNGLIWIRVAGKGTVEVSTQLREFATQQVAVGSRHFVLDLAECPVMDSTFMGTLLAISRDISGVGNRIFDLVNVNDRNLNLLKNLGLSEVLSVDEKGERWGEERRSITSNLSKATCANQHTREKKASVMLEAHEALVGAKPENESQFSDVIRYLRNAVS